jgi:hypothetical protein
VREKITKVKRLRVQQGYRTFIFLCDYAFKCSAIGTLLEINMIVCVPDSNSRKEEKIWMMLYTDEKLRVISTGHPLHLYSAALGPNPIGFLLTARGFIN